MATPLGARRETRGRLALTARELPIRRGAREGEGQVCGTSTILPSISV